MALVLTQKDERQVDLEEADSLLRTSSPSENEGVESRPTDFAARWACQRSRLALAGATFLMLGAVVALMASKGNESLAADRDLESSLCDDVGVDPTAAVVVTYNLFWWCVSDKYGTCKQNSYGKGFDKLGERLRLNHPFDMIGLQECEDIDTIVAKSGYKGCMEYHKGWPPNDIPQAWNTRKFSLVDKGTATIAYDNYGARWLNWVRLASKQTGGIIFFANAHGPLEECDGQQGENIADNYVKAIEANKKPGDVVIFTGDFNCGTNTDMTIRLSGRFANDATDKSFGGADHVLSSGLHVLDQAVVNGTPSDHQMVKATLRVPGASTGGLPV
eukprot:TRINITY_DN17707_c0_g1_i1.p2 TRINITY_DN17707_c0_g1~~TRINITY_DN17707_c0_g1_i1.p2  ORF type:complete len:373 (-),score=54.28 TRINITY_DN17707_c0_g1_i1:439-1431(-)